jgi:flagellar biosynthesis chaperone FliJ
MKRKDIEQLQSLLTHVLNRDMARLAGLTDGIKSIAEGNEKLSLRAREEFPSGESIAELKSYGAWLGWSAKRRAELAERRHALMDQAESARQALAESLGRTEALKSVAGRIDKEELRAQRRRAEQDGVTPDR